MASLNGTLIVRPDVSLTDDAGNTWTFHDGQVYENGVLDALTNRVVAIGFINGQVVQQNTDNLWWAKTGQGYDGWGTPGYADGHIDNPIFKAKLSSDPSVNSPGHDKTIVPQSTSPLVDTDGNLWWIDNGKVVENGTIDWNTRGVIEMVSRLGKIYQENDQGLWWEKTYQNWGGWGTPGTPDGHTTTPPTASSESATVVNIDGAGTFDAGFGTWQVNDYIINMAPNSNLTGSFDFANRYVGGGSFVINPTYNDIFYNTESYLSWGYVDIPIPVAGAGVFNVAINGKLEFESSVGNDQWIGLASGGYPVSRSVLQLDKPMEFLGSVTLYHNSGSMIATINLEGMANADSYTFQNDMLSIFSGQTVIDTLRLHDSTTNGFEVDKTPTGVSVVTIVDPTQIRGGLPIHAAG